MLNSIRKSFFGRVPLLAFCLVLGLFILISPASAIDDYTPEAVGNTVITVTDELGNALAGASVNLQCETHGGTAYSNTTNGAGVLTVSNETLQENPYDCVEGPGAGDTDTMTITVSKDGYVTSVSTDSWHDHTSNDNGISLSFGVKITVTKEDAMGVATGADVKAGLNFSTQCTEDDTTGIYYCAVPLNSGTSLSINQAGFVQQTEGANAYANRSAGTDPQRSISRGGFEYGHVVSTNVAGATVTGNSGAIACDASGSTYYCPIPKGVGDSTIDLALAGYNGVSTTASRRSDDTDEQVLVDMTADTDYDYEGVGFDNWGIFPLAISVADEFGEAVGAPNTITFDGQAPTTSSDGTYYFAHIGTNEAVVINKDGYINNASTNTALNDVTASGDGNQTIINLGDHAASTLAIEDGTTVNIKGFVYPLKVVVSDELGNSFDGDGLDVATYNGVAPARIDGNELYFASVGVKQSLILEKTGFVPSASTNSSFVGGETTGVTTSATGPQVLISLGDFVEQDDGEITETGSAKGFEYKLISDTLKSEVGGAVTSIASGFDPAGGSPSEDIEISAGTGTTIVSSAVTEGGVIYIALTHDGGGDDTVNIQLQNVTADAGAADAANFVKAQLADTSNQISDTTQSTFAVGAGSEADIILESGFLYPLKVSFADEIGTDIDVADLGSATFNDVSPYVVGGEGSEHIAYFANLAQNSVLTATKDGYVDLINTNSGLVDTDVTQAAQTTLSLGSHASKTTALDSGVPADAKGLQYGFVVNSVEAENGGALSDVTVETGDALGTLCTESESTWYCAVPLADTSLGIRVLKDGFVSNFYTPFGSDRTSSSDSQVAIDITGVLYSHKITLQREGDGVVIDSATITTNDGGVFFVEGGEAGIYYAAVPVAADGNAISAAATGYETDTSAVATDRAGNQSAQVALELTLDFQLRVAIHDQLGTSINASDLDVITFDGQEPTLTSGDAAYWAIEPVTKGTLVIQKDGYVDSGVSNAGFVSGETTGVTTSASNGQTFVNLWTDGNADDDGVPDGNDGFALGLEYALRVEVNQNWQTAGAYLDVDGATVTVGNDYDTTCVEGDGYYYCAIPADDDETSAKIVKSGYTTGFANYPDREEATDAQGKITAYLAVPAGNNGQAPNVAYVYPLEESVEIPISINPYVELDKPLTQLDLSTLTTDNIKLCDDAECEDSVSITISYSNAPGNRTRITLIPDLALAYENTYFIWVTNGVKDIANNSLGVEVFQSEFTTADSGADVTAPIVEAVSPILEAGNVSVNVQPLISFSEPMAVVTFTSSVIKLCQVGEGCDPVAATVQALEGNTKARIIPDAALDYDTAYYIEISDTATDLAGNPIAGGYSSNELPFTTADSGADVTAPIVEAVSPILEAGNVSVNVQPLISFSEPMAVGTFTSSVIKLCQVGEGCDPVAATVQALEGNTKARIIPDAALDYDTAYYIEISDTATDLAGNPIAGGYSSNELPFTTAEAGVAALEVTGISAVANGDGDTGFAEAGGGYDGGFAWVFNITTPSAQALRLKFSDFVSGANSIAAAGNIRYCSAQSDTDCEGDEAWVEISDANEYGDFIIIDTDLSDADGYQIQVKVEMKVPAGTAGGSYSASYGVQTAVG